MFTKTATIAAGLLVTAPALAGGPDSFLSIDNHYDAAVDVRVDGRSVGIVGGDRSRVVETRPGWRTVTFCTTTSNVCFQSESMRLRPHRTVGLNVTPPPQEIVFANTGSVGLMVEVGNRDVWLRPGERKPITVTAGRISASARMWHNERLLDTVYADTFLVEPGRREVVRLDFAPPVVYSTLVLTNAERHSVKVYADGGYLGVLRPGQTRNFRLPVGIVSIRATTMADYGIFDTRTSVRSAGTTRVAVVDERARARPHSHSHAAHGPHDTCSHHQRPVARR